MLVTFRFKDIKYTAEGKYDKDDNTFEIRSIDYQGADVKPIIESLGLIEDFEAEACQFI